jgi:tRNA(Phe) wybutosine-synthesizing methylase Tyw3
MKKEDLSVEKTEEGRFYVADENYYEITGNSYGTHEEAEEELRELYDDLAAEEAREAAEEARDRNEARNGEV